MHNPYDIDTESDTSDSDNNEQINKKDNSSDEEIEKEFNAFFKSKSNFKPKSTKKELANDFENEMNLEINNIIKQTHENYKDIKEKEGENENKISKINEKVEDVEDEDTDSEAELETGVRTTKKRPKFTNDELFYDPDMDEQDQNWINKQRKTCKKIVTPVKNNVLKSILKKTTATSTNSILNTDENEVSQEKIEQKITYLDAQTDAILNCPCCMTTLCMDSQRHETYKTQYRAMFVSNCKINQEEQLKYPKEKVADISAKKFRKNKKKVVEKTELIESTESAGLNELAQEYDIFSPVMCQICATEVGVYEEKEEIYHFFNVLTSHS